LAGPTGIELSDEQSLLDKEGRAVGYNNYRESYAMGI